MARKSNPLPSREVLNQLLRYEPEEGKLYFRPRPLEFFTAEKHSPAHSCAKWNSRWAGKEALTKLNVGYRCGRLLYQYVLAHRVIFKMMTGIEAVEVDHIDGDRANNKWKNLREVDGSGNRRNAALRSDNKSGQVGVVWHKKNRKWQVGMNIDGKFVFLGQFNNLDMAIQVRKEAEAAHNFHKNHGRMALKLIPKEK